MPAEAIPRAGAGHDRELAFLDEHFALDQAALGQRLTDRIVAAYDLEDGAQTPVDGLAGETTRSK